MYRCQFTCTKSLGLLYALAVIEVLASSYSVGQEVNTSGKRTVIDAIRAMDSSSEKDLEWVVAFLETRLAENGRDSIANCVLAIAQFRAQDFASAMKSIEQANSGDNAKLTRATTGKFQLLCAINADDGETATMLFQSLLNACQRESTPLALRKSFCEWMGEIIGVLDSEEAQSPIELELLAKAKKSLLGIAETKLSQAFENQYSQSHARAEEIKKALHRYAELGVAGMQDLDRTMSDELEKLEQILAASVKETKELSNENQAATKNLRQEIVGIREQIRRAEAEWDTITPGIPIPVQPPFGSPVLPNREAIYVNPVYTRLITEIYNNQSITRTVVVPRDFRDIDAERNAIFQTQMVFYQTQMNNFSLQSSLFSQYQKNLVDWKKRDEERRKKLSEQRKALEDQIAQIKIKLDAIEGIKKGNAGGNSELRSSIVQLKSEHASVRKVLNAANKGKPNLALRPITIDAWLIGEEKNRLLKLFTEKP